MVSEDEGGVVADDDEAFVPIESDDETGSEADVGAGSAIVAVVRGEEEVAERVEGVEACPEAVKDVDEDDVLVEDRPALDRVFGLTFETTGGQTPATNNVDDEGVGEDDGGVAKMKGGKKWRLDTKSPEGQCGKRIRMIAKDGRGKGGEGTGEGSKRGVAVRMILTSGAIRVEDRRQEGAERVNNARCRFRSQCREGRWAEILRGTCQKSRVKK